MRPIAIVCGLGCLLMSGCMRNEGLPGEVTGAFEQAFTRDDLRSTVGLFADDAQILPQDGPVVSGRVAIEQYLKNQMTPVISYDTETDMSIVRGDLGVEQGHYRVRDVRRGSDIEEGKYVHVWRRASGDWKLYRVIYNTDVAADTEVSVAQTAAEAE